MGAWGVGLFANDLSSDLKATFHEVVRLPVSEAELVRKLLDEYPAGRDPADEDYTDFWLALADLFHAHGLNAPEVFERARSIIESGADLETKRALEMSESDLRKRAKLLDGLPEKWRVPLAKPRKRRVVKAPEQLLFEPGDAVAYPIQGGNAAPAHFAAAEIARAFSPDGWGAFVVLATARRHGYWACYLVARLHLGMATKPTLDDCRKAVISGLRPPLLGLPKDSAVKTVAISKTEAKKLALETIGRLDLDQDALRAEFADRYALVDDPYWSIAGLLRPHGEGWSLVRERPVAMNNLPLDRFLS